MLEVQLPAATKVRTISALGEGVSSRTKAKAYVRQGRAKWTDHTRTAIIFDDADYRHECALRSQEAAADRRARLEHRPALEISTWPPTRVITGIPHQILVPHGFLHYPQPNSTSRGWITARRVRRSPMGASEARAGLL